MTVSKSKTTSSVPLYDLNICIGIIRVLQENGGSLARDALAAQLNTTSSSSKFNSKLASGRYFGLLSYDQDIVHISDLSKRIVSPITPNESSNAICRAFENISTYKELVRRYGSVKTPSKELIANFFEREYGFSPNSKKKVASAYLKSLETYLRHSSRVEDEKRDEISQTETSEVYRSTPPTYGGTYFRLGRVIGQLIELMKSEEPPSSILEVLFETLLEIPQLASLQPTIKQHAQIASEMKRADILMPDIELIQRLVEGEKDG